MDFEKNKDKLNKIISIGLCGLLFVIAIAAFFSPIITIGDYSITPFRLAVSRTIDSVTLEGYNLPVSFVVFKIFYIIFALGLIGTLFLVVFFFITKDKKLNKRIYFIMSVTLIFLFVSMIAGINYQNIYNTIGVESRTFAFVFFILGAVLLAAKYISGIFIKADAKEELKESSLSIIMSFVLTVLTICTLFVPLYIFPGTPHRINGIDLIAGRKEDILSFLPMTGFYRAIIIIFIIFISVSFIISVLLFLKKRKVFIIYNKCHNLVGFLAIFLYALMGFNYMLVYIDAKAYNQVLVSLSMNTYSYIPLVLFALFWVGVAFTKMVNSKVTVEYKVYAKPEGGENNYSIRPEKKTDINEEVVPDPIPAFSELDRQSKQFKIDYENRKQNIFQDLTLPKLVNHVIDYAKYSKEKLSYGKIEIKTFIAGLAASRLSILQGMSGTGKTSLPKIFMEAINGICELVAVESSWRDKNELLGYYNEFNKKYTPKSFTQFLYKAALNKETPYFIVLDELNLSRIEYYFSDFLSLMEGREENRCIKLFDVQLYPNIDERTDYLALRNGHTIDVPANIWFIGTANRDESTFEISDKVYDRAQTMNFDKRAPKVTVEQADYPKQFVPYSELKNLFNKALNSLKFDAESYDTVKKVEALLRPYNISFGNRILKQIEEFVKVYVACSETATSLDRDKYIHEAFDCIIFSKVVRKLEFKQVGDIESLVGEFAGLKLTKCEEFLRTLVETI